MVILDQLGRVIYVAKDRLIGAMMLIAAILIWLCYTYYGLIYIALDKHILSFLPEVSPTLVIAIPVWLGMTAILFIVAWIGWTMATTPPPESLEELSELEELEEKEEEKEGEKAEEKAEEEKVEEKA